MIRSKRFVSIVPVILLAFGLRVTPLKAQPRLTIDSVYSANLRNSGTIRVNGQIKGYFFLYISGKIDKYTNAYTLQILDENLNKTQSIRFEDSRRLYLAESAYNGNSISFLFRNIDKRTFDLNIYDFSGRLIYTYSRPIEDRTDQVMAFYGSRHSDEGMNKRLFDIGGRGYALIMPLPARHRKAFEVDFYSTESKVQWTYVSEDSIKPSTAEYLGCT